MCAADEGVLRAGVDGVEAAVDAIKRGVEALVEAEGVP